jgi:hypothetical protein
MQTQGRVTRFVITNGRDHLGGRAGPKEAFPLSQLWSRKAAHANPSRFNYRKVSGPVASLTNSRGQDFANFARFRHRKSQ